MDQTRLVLILLVLFDKGLNTDLVKGLVVLLNTNVSTELIAIHDTYVTRFCIRLLHGLFCFKSI